jgi:hypothetical protein
MNEEEISKYIVGTFEGVETAMDGDNVFFFFGPERMFPFATLSANDAYDQASDLNRPGVFRLNMGVSKETFRALFGTPGPASDTGEKADSEYDYKALNRLMPHPIYGRQYWVCILTPSDTTFQESVRPLLAEAYEKDVRKHTKRADRS